LVKENCLFTKKEKRELFVLNQQVKIFKREEIASKYEGNAPKLSNGEKPLFQPFF
jgi:hypothetical protein